MCYAPGKLKRMEVYRRWYTFNPVSMSKRISNLFLRHVSKLRLICTRDTSQYTGFKSIDNRCRPNCFCVPDIVRIPSPVIATGPDPVRLPYKCHSAGNPARLCITKDVLRVRRIRHSLERISLQDPARPACAGFLNSSYVFTIDNKRSICY